MNKFPRFIVTQTQTVMCYRNKKSSHPAVLPSITVQLARIVPGIRETWLEFGLGGGRAAAGQPTRCGRVVVLFRGIYMLLPGK